MAAEPHKGPCITPRPWELNRCRGTVSVKECGKVAGHPGGHGKEVDYCNRPWGHDGPHAIYNDMARKLAEWTSPARGEQEGGL